MPFRQSRPQFAGDHNPTRSRIYFEREPVGWAAQTVLAEVLATGVPGQEGRDRSRLLRQRSNYVARPNGC